MQGQAGTIIVPTEYSFLGIQIAKVFNFVTMFTENHEKRANPRKRWISEMGEKSLNFCIIIGVKTLTVCACGRQIASNCRNKLLVSHYGPNVCVLMKSMHGSHKLFLLPQ